MAAICGTVSSWSKLVLRHRDFLIKNLEPDYGLIDNLYAIEVLSDEDMADVCAKDTVYKRNSKLLEYIQAKGNYDRLIETLKSSNQTHVVNYLEKNGIYANDDDWPLLDQQRKILRTNRASLIDLLDVQDLLSRLYSSDVINRRQRDFISSKQTPDEQNRALLDILSRRSIRDYNRTIIRLHESKQSRIAQILEEGGVVVRVHAVIPDDRTEDDIVSQFVGALDSRSTEESRRILERTLNVIAVKKGKSIVVYVYCKTTVELLNLKELEISGKLVTVLQKLFIDVLLFAEFTVENPKSVVESTVAENHLAKMTATFNKKEYEKSKIQLLIEEERMNEVVSSQDQFGRLSLKPAKGVDRGCEEKETQGNTDGENMMPEGRYPDPWGPDIKNLPSELIDIISRKCFLQSRLEENVMKHVTDKEVIIHLASVQFNWFQRIIKRRLKNKIWRQLSEILKRNEKTAAIFRNNRLFLEKNCIRPKGFIRQLKSFDCLTDVQALMVKRQKFKSRQQHRICISDLLNVVKSCDKSRQLSFGRCLRQNGQRDAARVEMNGGGKMHCYFCDSKNSKNIYMSSISVIIRILKNLYEL